MIQRAVQYALKVGELTLKRLCGPEYTRATAMTVLCPGFQLLTMLKNTSEHLVHQENRIHFE